MKEQKQNTPVPGKEYLVFYTYLYVEKTKKDEGPDEPPLSTYAIQKDKSVWPTCKGAVRFGGPDRTFK
ncbi:hypothetical protein ES703_65556 [subsurface metagenome]